MTLQHAIRFFFCVTAGALVALHPLVANAAGREPVLKQVSVPHPYYWREMYVPHLTDGPSSLAWTPDGKSLVFSMRGRLWRQRIASRAARQLTTGAGYDYQPDVSPDGKHVIYAHYENDAIELYLLDLRSGKTRAFTENQTVNLEPRWSPDGSKVVYVTTQGSGEFHIAIAEFDGQGWRHRRWLPERKSETSRYYYSKTDHELNPVWSADGADLIFVSNAEIAHGTGNIYRRPLDLSSPAELLRAEETSWAAQPDVSPDGKRLAYSSYAGRQWRQLWMTTASPGGYPMPFSYGEYDISAPRWSPDGAKIAYVSNQQGGLEIVIQEVVGGAADTLKQDELDYAQPMATLSFSILGEGGEPVAARVSVTGADGRYYAPRDEMIHADDGFDRAAQTAETQYFHTDGMGEVMLPRGDATVTVWRGLKYAVSSRKITVGVGAADIDIELQRLGGSDFLAGWRSGDPHVHMNYGGRYRMTPALLLRRMNAENLDVVFNLIVNKEQRIPDIRYFSTEPVRDNDRILAMAQEFHTSVWGHMGLLGLEDHYLIPDYVGYSKTAVESLYPDNATIAELAHEQNAVVGYVHPFDVAPDPETDAKLTHSLPVDVALGNVDYLEVVGFSDHRETEKIWHRLLNCGFRLPAAGATDAMTNYASLRGPVGMNRTYVMTGAGDEGASAELRAWLDGLKAGKSFATNAPLLKLEVAGAGPGGEIKLRKGARKLSWSAEMHSIAPVDRVEVVVNGQVAALLPLSDEGRAAAGSGDINIAESGWVTLRAVSDEASPLVFDAYPFATTSPVYVTVGGEPPRSAGDAGYFIKWIDRLIAFARASDSWNTDNERDAVLDHLQKARREFEKRR